MTESTDAEKTTTEEEATPAATTDPRESKAFKAVTGQLSERDSKIEALQKKLDKHAAAEEARTLKANEEAGDYTANLEALNAKIAAAEAKVTAAEARVVTQAEESAFLTAIAADVQSPKARSFLMREYMGLEERPDPAAWIVKASEDEEYASFFGSKQRTPPGGAPAPRANSASHGTQTTPASEQELLKAGDKDTKRRVFYGALGQDDPG